MEISKQVAATDKKEKEDFTFQINVSSDGYTFDLKIEGIDGKEKPKKTREKLRQAGGQWNKERHSYVFMISDMSRVKDILGDDSITAIADPTKTILLNFQIRFQCDDLAGAQDLLKKIGIQQQRSGEWVGEFSQLGVFSNAFNCPLPK